MVIPFIIWFSNSCSIDGNKGQTLDKQWSKHLNNELANELCISSGNDYSNPVDITNEKFCSELWTELENHM